MESQEYSDAARRAADNVNALLVFWNIDEIRNKFMAVRLSDGGYDGTLYDTKRDAVRHQTNEFQCAYVCFRNLLNGVSYREMEIFLKFNRDAYDKGFRLADPDDAHGGRDVLMTTAAHDYYGNLVDEGRLRRYDPNDFHDMLKGLGL